MNTMGQKKNNKIEILVAIVIILFSMGLRLNAPRADLPTHITFSGSILTDEGNQCYNSRSKVLFNEWFPDDWRITNYNPVLPYIKLGYFKLFGVGLLQLRFVNFTFAFFSLLFFFLLLKSYFKENRKFVWLGSLFLGINFLYIMYNKIGTFETSITFWVIMTLYFLEKYRRNPKGLFLFLSGSAAIMGFIFKSIMAYLIPLPFAAVILMHLFPLKNSSTPPLADPIFSFKKMARDLSFVLMGVLVFWVPWYLLHYLPNRDWILNGPGKFMGGMILPDSLSQAWQNFLSFPWREQFFKIPVVWVGALIYVPVFIRRLFSRRASFLEMATTLFFFAHTFMFLFMYYRPTRYFVPVIPVMVLMTTLLFERWYSFSQSSPSVRVQYQYGRTEKIVIYILDIIWFAGLAYYCVAPIFRRLAGLNPWRPRPTLYYFLVSLLLVSAAYYFKPLLEGLYGTSNPKEKWQVRKLTNPLIVLLILLSLTVNLGYYWDWYSNRTYAIYDMSLEWKEKLHNAYIAGMTAAASILETNHKTLWLYPNFVNWEKNTLKKYGVTHALLGTDISREIINFFNQWPELMSKTKLEKIYHIKDYFLHFYSFVAPYIQSIQSIQSIQNIQDLPVKGTPNYRLTLINPTSQPIQIRVGMVYRLPNTPDLMVRRGEEVFQLTPGENQITTPTGESAMLIPGDATDLLFFLDYPDPLRAVDQPLRFEGENFRADLNINKREQTASNHLVRYYNQHTGAPGFICNGPNVPFAPGVMVADFNIAFSKMKTKLHPLCQLEIFSVEDNTSLVKLSINGSMVKKSTNGEKGYNTFRLVATLPQTRTLNFRLKVKGAVNVALDYIDVTYYQGIFLPKNTVQ